MITNSIQNHNNFKMYLDYFQLNQEPFNIAPNPNMLYPSARHKEAIAYLQYGLRGAGGFVMLTGEVGTGKTMVSRAVLGDLPEHFNVAYILNPTLNNIQLLQTVCEAFEIQVSENADLKQLSDGLQSYLIEQNQLDKSCLLVIDEAQHLSAEALEQLRLFTNLETNEKKLLQIILIGQPELQEKLNTRELRQLAQRITARYHLLPLTKSETYSYINHRLQFAGALRPLFDKKAMNWVFKLSKGTPRLINLLADRCLMGAFASSASYVDQSIVIKAAQEVLLMSEPGMAMSWWQNKLSITLSALTVIAVCGVSFWLLK
ncbi:MAG: AAA family ATPase [Gammaproteobacteria bacterium]|nr:AAA family ATPase [Gammaproteobacteria bacterium]